MVVLVVLMIFKVLFVDLVERFTRGFMGDRSEEWEGP
jgi:hypothetical protein